MSAIPVIALLASSKKIRSRKHLLEDPRKAPPQWDGADSSKRHALCKRKSKGRANLPCSSSPTLGRMADQVTLEEFAAWEERLIAALPDGGFFEERWPLIKAARLDDHLIRSAAHVVQWVSSGTEPSLSPHAECLACRDCV